MSALLVALAGGAGAITRLVVDGEVRERLARTRFAGSPLPWATGVVNVTGSLLLGLVTGAALLGSAPTTTQRVVGTGFCGGYTTFSTASVETLRLLRDRRWGAAALAAAVPTALCVAAAAVGIAVGGAW